MSTAKKNITLRRIYGDIREKLVIPYTLLCGENVKMSIIDPETGMKINPQQSTPFWNLYAQQLVTYTKDSVILDLPGAAVPTSVQALVRSVRQI